MSNCKHCGQPFEPGDRNYSGSGHFNPYTCISNLRARADAAETEAAALRARVAELEGQLQAAEFELATFKLETKSDVIEMSFLTPDGPKRLRYAASPLPDIAQWTIDQDDEEE